MLVHGDGLQVSYHSNFLGTDAADIHPLYSQTTPPDAYTVNGVVQLLHLYKWKNVACLWRGDGWGLTMNFNFMNAVAETTLSSGAAAHIKCARRIWQNQKPWSLVSKPTPPTPGGGCGASTLPGNLNKNTLPLF